jgi:exodeoxyribonuclease V alpha subunit
MSEPRIEIDEFDVRRALRPRAELRAFNEAGVLAAADVHVAARLMALAGEDDPEVALAAALAVRAPRLGHVYADLATVRDTTVVDVEQPVDISALPWPDEAAWLDRLRASRLAGGPLRLDGTRVYLDRYWREERQIADDLRAFAGDPEAAGAAVTPADGAAPSVREDVLAAGLARLFGPDDDRQRAAAEAAVRRRLAVVAGGPGTGKTTTVARIAALLNEQAAAAGVPAPLIALAAPTGKAAARLEEAVHDEARNLDVEAGIRDAMLALEASTLHRLLGRRRGSHSRFRHHRGNRLPHDVVVVDETSMVSLSLMARLVEAVRPDARLVLVGDPGQLSSIEAGAVLGDIVGPATGAGIVVLDRVHRFGGGIAALADAVRAGDAAAALAVLRSAPAGVTWIESDPAEEQDALGLIRRRAVDAGRAILRAARDGDADAALRSLGAFRLLCAHRRGPYGVAAWGSQIEAWLTADVAGFSADDRWYPGRPLLVTENDYGLRLYNGDTGVVVAHEGRVSAAFERRGDVMHVAPSRLESVETVHAMTIHKAQGSQFGTAAVLLPDRASRLLTRELLYTAITRAREELILAGTEDAVRAAVERPVARASGLRELLWDPRPRPAGRRGVG